MQVIFLSYRFIKKMKFIRYKFFSIFFFIICLLSGCNMILMDPRGIIGIEQKKIILISLGLMLIIVIPVIFMAVFFSRKYRENNEIQSTIYRPNWDHSYKIEIICWLIPIVIILVLAFITWRTTHDLDPFKPVMGTTKPIPIQVISSDWKWIFIYPEQNIATVNEIAIPVGSPIHFKITSASVMNSFFIPALGSQIYAMPGMQTQLYLLATKQGIYNGFSSNYSGHGFSGMKFNVIVKSNINEFNQWIKKVKLSSKNLNNEDLFKNLLKLRSNFSVMYFSNVIKNLYEKLVLSFNN